MSTIEVINVTAIADVVDDDSIQVVEVASTTEIVRIDNAANTDTQDVSLNNRISSSSTSSPRNSNNNNNNNNISDSDSKQGDSDNDNIDEEDNVKMDRYGFYSNDEFHKSKVMPVDVLLHRQKKEVERTKKWLRMIKYRGLDFVSKYRRNKFNRRVNKGIPDSVRSVVWMYLSGIHDIEKMYPDITKLTIELLPQRTVDEIEHDIDRTFPRHFLFMHKEGLGQNALRVLLQRYACIDPDVGYCQGMGFVAGFLLTYYNESDAFYMFASILQKKKYKLRELYLPNMIDAQKKIYTYGQLGKKHLNNLWDYLEDQGMHPTMYVTEWIMCLYCRGFSFDLVTRVFEIFLKDGYIFIYKVALALIKSVAVEILSSPFEKIMNILRNLPSLIDSDNVINIALYDMSSITQKHIDYYEEEYATTLNCPKIMHDV